MMPTGRVLGGGRMHPFLMALFKAGVFAQAIAFSTVPRGTARLRLRVSATHTRQDLEFALQTLAEVADHLRCS